MAVNCERLTEKLIDFALHYRSEDIPSEVIDFQKRILADSIGVMAAAASLEPACLGFIEFARENSPEGTCKIIGTPYKASLLMAALANGSLIHALDYEDGHDAAKAHPNTASIPVMIALGQALGRSGRQVLDAMVIASEIAIRLKLALTVNDLTDCGLYSPPMFAAYGAVLGASRLAGLNEMQTLDALSLCMTQIILPGQSARSAGSVLRGVREALAARAAMFGVLLAQKGVHARMDEPFEGAFGLYMSCFRNGYGPETILGGLGERWEAGRLRLKPWPCCGTAHAALDTLLRVMEENGLKQEDIRGIHLVVNKPHLNLLEPHEVKYRPKSLAAAKFSLPFTLALAAVNGGVTLELYTEMALEDRRLLELADMVTYERRAQEKPEQFPDDHVEVIITTADGGKYSSESFVSPGSPLMPLSREQTEGKFFDCMSHGLRPYSHEESAQILDAILKLEDCPDFGSFCALLD